MSGAASYPCLLQGGCGYEDFRLFPFARNAIGFETLFDRLNDRSSDNSETYPPYDIVRKGEDAFQINLALAGFAPEDITVTSEASQLTVAGKKPENQETDYLYQGIRRGLSSGVSVLPTTSKSKMPRSKNGLLHINLVRRVPERMKPRGSRSETSQAGYERNRQGRLSL